MPVRGRGKPQTVERAADGSYPGPSWMQLHRLIGEIVPDPAAWLTTWQMSFLGQSSWHCYHHYIIDSCTMVSKVIVTLSYVAQRYWGINCNAAWLYQDKHLCIFCLASSWSWPVITLGQPAWEGELQKFDLGSIWNRFARCMTCWVWVSGFCPSQEFLHYHSWVVLFYRGCKM